MKPHPPALNVEDIGFLAALVVKAAVAVSHADDEAGERDDRLERKALERVIDTLARDRRLPSFVIVIVRYLDERRDLWDVWAQAPGSLTADCARVVEIMRDRAKARDVRNYRALVLRVASAVAGAYGEFGDDTHEQGGIVSRLLGFLFPPRQDAEIDFMNFSAAEQDILNGLKSALTLPEAS